MQKKEKEKLHYYGFHGVARSFVVVRFFCSQFANKVFVEKFVRNCDKNAILNSLSSFKV